MENPITKLITITDRMFIIKSFLTLSFILIAKTKAAPRSPNIAPEAPTEISDENI
jgi:hypothetical protein